MTAEEQSAAESPRFSVVLPIYEEEATIEALILELGETLSMRSERFEIIAVDDGSGDGTLEILRKLRQTLPGHLKVVQHLTNRGNGAALRTGVRVAEGEIVVFMDADGQHSPADIDKLVREIPPYDLVIGARTAGYGGPRHRIVANRFYNSFASWLSGRRIDDLTSGFRAMRRQAVRHFLPLYPDGFSAPTTTTLAFLKAGYNVAFIPIDVRDRKAGKSKINLLQDGANFFVVILRMIMLYDPLRIFLPISLLVAMLGIAAWLAGILNAARLVLPNSAIFLFTAALVTFLLGLVASQISASRIFYHGDETIVMDDEYTRTSRD